MKKPFLSPPIVYCVGGARQPAGQQLRYYIYGKIAKMLLDEANDFSCATTDVLAFKMLYCTSFF